MQTIDPAEGGAYRTWAFPALDEPSEHLVLYGALFGTVAWPQTQVAPSRSMEIVTALYRSADLGRTVTKAELSGPHLHGSLPMRVDV